MQRFLLYFSFFLFPFLATGQAISFEASADARQLVLGDIFQVDFTLKNAEGTGFQAPTFKDFTVRSGPNRGVSTTIINGARTVSYTFSYVLMPKKIGNLTIESAAIQANGKTYKTQPLTIEVMKGNSSANVPKTENGGNGKVFIKAIANQKEASVGTMITLDYKLFTSLNIDHFEVVSEPEYNGFFAKEIYNFNSEPVREVVNGQQFTTKVLRRIALYPQQVGNLTVSPMTLRVAVIVPNEDPFFSLLPETQMQTLQTEEIKIHVNPLPNDAPADFSGAVGRNFTLGSSLDKTVLSTDDAINFRLNIKGSADMKRIQAPKLNLPEGFEVYEPKIIEENMQEVNGEMLGSKTFEYQILPKKVGQFNFTPSLTYFDNVEKKYKKVEGESYQFTITQGSNTKNNTNSTDFIDSGQKDSNPIVQGFKSLLVSPILWIGLVLLGAAIFGMRWYKNAQNKTATPVEKTISPIEIAQKMAEKRLQVAEKHLKSSESKAFYDETSKAILGYISDKLSIPLANLSKSSIQEKLKTLNIKEAYIQELMQMLQTCEMALYAGKDNSQAMQTTYQQAKNILANIEAEMKR